MTSFDEILESARRPEDVVPLCLRGDLVAEFRRLEQDLAGASTVAVSLGERAPAKVIAERMQALRAEMAEAAVPVRIRALEPRAWSDFHATRPTKTAGEDQALFDDRWHAWICDMVARTVVDPPCTAEQVEQLVPRLSHRQWKDLTDACWLINAGEVSIPFSAAASALTSIDAPK